MRGIFIVGVLPPRIEPGSPREGIPTGATPGNIFDATDRARIPQERNSHGCYTREYFFDAADRAQTPGGVRGKGIPTLATPGGSPDQPGMPVIPLITPVSHSSILGMPCRPI